jgi:23S rRNA pseudouridine1911/1915/1917 synthase
MALRTRWRRGDRFLVRHKDAAIVVVEKKAGLLTVATEAGRGENLLHLLRSFLGTKGRSGALYPVHRLDRVVSGLLVFARTPDARSALVEQFSEHTVERKYIAALRGVLAEDRGTLESRLVTDDPSLYVYSDELDEGEGRGRRAVTHWRVLERYQERDATLVEVELETGLRNQIRVQFAEAGHPLLGERKYRGGERPLKQGHERIFLHAAVLGFVHPRTRERLRFEAPLPPDLAAWKNSLRALKPAPRQRPRKKR